MRRNGTSALHLSLLPPFLNHIPGVQMFWVIGQNLVQGNQKQKRDEVCFVLKFSLCSSTALNSFFGVLSLSSMSCPQHPLPLLHTILILPTKAASRIVPGTWQASINVAIIRNKGIACFLLCILCRYYYRHAHFTDEEAEAKEVN